MTNALHSLPAFVMLLGFGSITIASFFSLRFYPPGCSYDKEARDLRIARWLFAIGFTLVPVAVYLHRL